MTMQNAVMLKEPKDNAGLFNLYAIVIRQAMTDQPKEFRCALWSDEVTKGSSAATTS